jgi:hypothetical protein
MAFSYSSLSELFLQIVNHFLVHLEGHSENIRIDEWIGSKDGLCYGDEPKILATKSDKSNNIGLSHIKLKVNETNGKDEHISCV